MASSSSSSSKSKYNNNPQWIYEVFISFRGEDTRSNFVSHLYAALLNEGIDTFLDDNRLDKGTELERELLRAIEGSRISIVVFSQNYVDSSWCLKELVEIVKCHENRGQVVMPVFYNVTPSYLRQYASKTGENLPAIATTLAKEQGEAILKTANFAGWDVRNWRNESILLKEIVDAVLKKKDRNYLPITDFPVGLESREQHVIEFLRKQTRGVSIVGIWGMGGIGKSTIAKVIYNKLHREFEHHSFLANIREVWEKDRGQMDLQEQLLSNILKTKEMKVYSVEWGKAMIKERLCTKKALVVLDDVSKIEQLNALCGNHNGIGSGSVIIITTRDVRLLDVPEVDYVYGVEELNDSESLELLSWHAFREASPKEGFLSLSRDVLAYCGGLPLALEVLGSHLYKRRTEEWQSVLSRLKKIPDNQIQEKLKISFDGLTNDTEKDIFLDICCFFIGKDRAYAREILNGCDLFADIGITVLLERSLVKVERNNKLGMHDLLRDMGREIVRRSSTKEPEKRSRLWFHEDVIDVLRENTGTEAIEGLALKSPGTVRYCFNANAFQGMNKLRLLQLDRIKLTGDYGHLSKKLKWISWQGFPLKYIPSQFDQGNVVAIDLKHSNLKLVWKEPQLLEWLKFLNLSHSRYLTNTPDFSKLPNLEKLILKDCPSLCKVHPSIGDLHKLLLLNLKDCIGLNILPSEIRMLKSLETLILSGCSKIDKIEDGIVQMGSLINLIAENTAVKQVPFSIVRSKSIGYISLCGYKGFSRDVFPSLLWSWMSPTMKPLSSFHPFGVMPLSLVSTTLQNDGWENLSPMLSSLSELRSVRVQCETESQLSKELRTVLGNINSVNFTELEITSYERQISNHSLRSYLIGMGSYQGIFNTLNKSILEGLTSNGSSNFVLPGDNYPSWLAYKGEGPSVCFQVPEDSDCCIKGMVLCVVHSSTPEDVATECLTSVLIVNHTKFTIQIYKRDTVMSFNDEDWEGLISNQGAGDNVEIYVAFGHGLNVKETAVYLVYGQSVTMDIEPSSNMEVEPWTNMKMEVSPNVETESSLKPNKNIFARLTKRVGECLCLNQNRCFNNS